MSTRTSHSDCDHPNTKSARAACRRARQEQPEETFPDEESREMAWIARWQIAAEEAVIRYESMLLGPPAAGESREQVEREMVYAIGKFAQLTGMDPSEAHREISQRVEHRRALGEARP